MTGDRDWMQRALALAEAARGVTSPNPWVGAVIVRDGEVVGEGCTRPVGGPHAEVVALEAARERARGATMYVTLEPCSHVGRTPPCADAVIAAGITRVVCAMIDPNPIVRGRGLDRMRAAGVEVALGVLGDEAHELIAPFVVAQYAQRPMVTLKLATSLDGRIATRTGASRWITGAGARAEVHRLREGVDAVLVGTGTLVADDPALTARPEGRAARRQPLRVVLDRALRAPLDRVVYDTKQAPTLVFVGCEAPSERRAVLEAAGVELCEVPDREGRLSLPSVLRELGQRGCLEVLCEGGAALAGSLFDARLVDRVHWVTAPIVIGNASAPGAVAGQGAETPDVAPRGRVVARRTFGDDVWTTIDFSPHLRAAPAAS